jgi:hypothetical protein
MPIGYVFFKFLKTKIMAEFKRRTLMLTTGKQIKLFGSSIAIGKSLEIGEGYAPNIFSLNSDPDVEKSAAVANPHKLTPEEMMEIADYNIRLWMDLKEGIRKYGVTSSKIFLGDSRK